MSTRVDAIAAAARFGDEGRFSRDLARRVSLRTESRNPERRPDCRAYCETVAADLEPLGFESRIDENASPSGGPILLARRHEGEDLPTVLIYGHGDTVAGMEGRWASGRDPWTLTPEGERLYGRGAADNKGQHTVNLLALEAVLATRGSLGFNVKLLLETSEEAGSPGLRTYCETHRDDLAADMLIASDGPRLAASRPTLYGGARGAFPFRLVCRLREGAHHSGNWGGLIANPATILANAIASLIDRTGRILARGIVPAAVPPSVTAAVARLKVEPEPGGPDLDPWWGEPGLTQAERVYAWTALEVLAMVAGDPAHPVNAIPPLAVAHMQIRHTIDNAPASFVPAIRAHLDAHGFGNVAVEVDEGVLEWSATRLDPDHPLMRWAIRSVQETTGQPPDVLPNLGGSLPNDCFADTLGLPTVWVPHSYSGCSQHAPDEHVLMPVMRSGLRVMAGLFWDLGLPEARVFRRTG